MNVVEIANIINTRTYRKVGYAVTKIVNMWLIGQITPIVVRNGRAEMKCRTVSDTEPIERQCVYEDNKSCNNSCRYSNTCIHSANKTEE